MMIWEEEEDEDEVNGKESRTFGQREIVHTSADNADTITVVQPTALHERGQHREK